MAVSRTSADYEGDWRKKGKEKEIRMGSGDGSAGKSDQLAREGTESVIPSIGRVFPLPIRQAISYEGATGLNDLVHAANLKKR